MAASSLRMSSLPPGAGFMRRRPLRVVKVPGIEAIGGALKAAIVTVPALFFGAPTFLAVALGDAAFFGDAAVFGDSAIFAVERLVTARADIDLPAISITTKDKLVQEKLQPSPINSLPMRKRRISLVPAPIS